MWDSLDEAFALGPEEDRQAYHQAFGLLAAWARAEGAAGTTEWEQRPGRTKDEIVAVLRQFAGDATWEPVAPERIEDRIALLSEEARSLLSSAADFAAGEPWQRPLVTAGLLERSLRTVAEQARVTWSPAHRSAVYELARWAHSAGFDSATSWEVSAARDHAEVVGVLLALSGRAPATTRSD